MATAEAPVLRIEQYEFVETPTCLTCALTRQSLIRPFTMLALMLGGSAAIYVGTGWWWLALVPMAIALYLLAALLRMIASRAALMTFDRERGQLQGSGEDLLELKKIVSVFIQDARGRTVDDIHQLAILTAAKRAPPKLERPHPPFSICIRTSDGLSADIHLEFWDLDNARLCADRLRQFLKLEVSQFIIPRIEDQSDANQVQQLRMGLRAWNDWRRGNPALPIVLDGADLTHIDLSWSIPRLPEGPLGQLPGKRLVAVSEGIIIAVEPSDAEKERVNLAGASLQRAQLLGANLSGALLEGANLREADLRKADLHAAILHGANLSSASLTEAKAWGADFTDADLSGADLSEAEFVRAKLGARLQGVRAWSADLRQADLSGANACGAEFRRADFRGAKLHGANLAGADLRSALLIDCDVTDAVLDGCRVHGASVWGLRGTPRSQMNLVITPEDAPRITVDDLSVAQLFYLLLDNRHVGTMLGALTSKVVLILGRFSPERKAVLDAVRINLRALGYLPVLFDFERAKSRDFTETVLTLAGLSLFVICDLTDPASVPAELEATVPKFMIPFALVIQKGEKPFSMFVDLVRRHDWILSPVLRYESAEDLTARLHAEVVMPAVRKNAELIQRKARVVA